MKAQSGEGQQTLHDMIMSASSIHIDDKNRTEYLHYIVEILVVDIIESLDSLLDETVTIGSVLKTRLQIHEQINTILYTQPKKGLDTIFESILADKRLLEKLTATWSFQDFQKVLQSMLLQANEYAQLIPALLKQLHVSYDNESMQMDYYKFNKFYYEPIPEQLDLLDAVLEVSLNARLRHRNEQALQKRQ